jgi:cystathionine gamma-synthase
MPNSPLPITALATQREAGLPPARVTRGPSTDSVHAGETRPNAYHSLTVPIVQTATYTFENTSDLCAFQDARMWGGARDRTEYGRYGNPTVAACEAKLAALDHGDDAILFSSGMAAVTTVLLAMLPAGHTSSATLLSPHLPFCLTFLKRFGITTTVVPMGICPRGALG